jgi:hypothetical protein
MLARKHEVNTRRGQTQSPVLNATERACNSA